LNKIPKGKDKMDGKVITKTCLQRREEKKEKRREEREGRGLSLQLNYFFVAFSFF